MEAVQEAPPEKGKAKKPQAPPPESAAKRSLSNPERFQGIKQRIKDVIENHGEDVQKNTPLRFPARLWLDFLYLTEEVDWLAGRRTTPPAKKEAPRPVAAADDV